MLEKRPLRALLLTALLVSLAGAGGAEVYRYTDAQGQVHFTDNPSLVPDRFRPELEQIDLTEDLQQGSYSRAPLGGPAGGAPPADDRFQPGQPDFEELKGQMEQWMGTWGVLFMAAGLVWGVITLASVFHAFSNQRVGWGIANFLSYVSVPIYFLIHLDRPMWVRSLLVIGWGAPFIVAPLVLRAGMSIVPG